MSRFTKTMMAAGFLFAALVGITERPSQGRDRKADPARLFETSDRCQACHNDIVSETGMDLSIGVSWRATMMAHSAKDPYWQGSVRRETLDHPGAEGVIEDTCATCHMPMARFVSRRSGREGQVLGYLPLASPGDDAPPHGHLATDGVSCAMCHQIEEKGLGRPDSFGGGFSVDTKAPPGERTVYGPFDIGKGTARIMRSSSGFTPEKGRHIDESALCGTCHTLYTHALDKNGNAVAELAEQVPYLEWLHSDYADVESCQDCHMETVDGKAPISSVLGKPREPFVRHSFKGGNFFMPKLMSRNAAALGVTALPGELAAAARDTADHLQSKSADLQVVGEDAAVKEGVLEVPVSVTNLTGHKLPTAYPSRRVWIHLTVRDSGNELIFESGALRNDGAIEGNDNDADRARFEPHHQEITDPGQVQIYESIMGTPEGKVTTGLLSAAVYLKDNRVTPSGFDKATAHKDIAVYGAAAEDADFKNGGDRVLYRVPVGEAEGPFQVTAELWYQPVGHRWAMNLDGVEGDEPKRFVSMYKAIPRKESAQLLAAVEASVSVSPPEEEQVGEASVGKGGGGG